MKSNWTLAAIGTMFLAACGGGGGDASFTPAPTPPSDKVAGTDVPTSATTDANAAYEFVASVAAAKSETSDSLVVGDATLAKSETDEPKAF